MISFWFREICGGINGHEINAAKFYRWYKEEIANCRQSRKREAKCNVWKEPSRSSTAIRDILTDIEWQLLSNPMGCKRIAYREFARECNHLRASYELETGMEDVGYMCQDI